MPRVLITGASSWEGTQLANRLASRRGYEVIAVDDMVASARLEVELHRHGLDTLEFAHFVLETDPTTIVHLQTMDRSRRVGSQKARESVVLGSQALFGAISRLTSLGHVVVNSDAAVYGTGPRHATILPESVHLTGRATRHERALREVERFVSAEQAGRSSTPFTVLRFGEVIGDNFDSPVIEYLRRSLVPTALGFDPLLQLLHEDDLVECLEASVLNPVGGVFNVAPKRPLYLSQILRLGGMRELPLPGPQLKLARRALRRSGIRLPSHTVNLLRNGRVLNVDRMATAMAFAPQFSTRDVARTLLGPNR
jgi:UDP-glucose 4-epimerase